MPSMRRAINEKCKDCIFDPAEPGNWRQQVTGCTSEDCALFPLRPMSESGAKSGRQSPEKVKP
jgi:hypothetical protein